MKKTDLPEATIDALSHDGRGVTTVNHKKIFIAGALPTERVNYQIIKHHERFDEAKCVTLLTPANDRAVPICQHFGTCGGCNLQHLNATLQLQLKQQILQEHFAHFGQIVPEQWLPPLSVNDVGYRHKARLGVRWVYKKNKVLVGFREKSSRYLADLTSCKTLHPRVGLKLTALSELIMSLIAKMHIPQLEVAIGDQAIALVLRHMQPLADVDLTKIASFAETENMQIYLQPNPPLPARKFYPDDQFERLSYGLPDQQIEFFFHPLDFTQINLPLNRQMINQALQLLALSTNDTVLDLFCGIGNFSLPLAQQASSVVGVEGNEWMVARAYENARHNTIHNVNFYAENLFAPKADAPWLKQTYSKILLDPPRSGAKQIIPSLLQLAANKILYISCNPATLARDAGELIKTGVYRLTQAGIMNMFPHTAHIEAMALFEKSSS